MAVVLTAVVLDTGYPVPLFIGELTHSNCVLGSLQVSSFFKGNCRLSGYPKVRMLALEMEDEP